MQKHMIQGGACMCCCSACGVRITGMARFLNDYVFCCGECMAEFAIAIEVLDS